jgi:HSP20 family protein
MAQKRYRPMDMRRWRPIRDIENTERGFLEDLDRFVEGNFPSLRFLRNWMPGGERPWVPMSEVYETDDKVIVRVELPGVNPDDVDILAEGDSLVVKGERKPAEGVSSEQYHECERCYGRFFRRIPLPEEADASKIEANFDKGILEVTISRPKTAKPTRTRIKIKKS